MPPHIHSVRANWEIIPGMLKEPNTAGVSAGWLRVLPRSLLGRGDALQTGGDFFHPSERAGHLAPWRKGEAHAMGVVMVRRAQA